MVLVSTVDHGLTRATVEAESGTVEGGGGG